MRVMSNPGQLLIAGNPHKKTTRTHKNKKKGIAMAVKSKSRKARSARAVTKRRTKRIARKASRKASRKGKMPAGLKRYWASKRKAKRLAAKPRRARGKVATKRSAKRRSKVRRRTVRVKNVVASKGTLVTIRKVRRGKVRTAAKRRGKVVRRVQVNAGSITLKNTVFGFTGNLSSSLKGGLKGWLSLAGGAGVSVVGGTLVSRITNNVVGSFAPALLANPFAARGLGALNYLLPAYAVAKYAPGLSGKTRRGIQAGAMLAAVLEAVRPGMLRATMANLPVVGRVFGGQLSGLADGMGDYLSTGMGLAPSPNDSTNQLNQALLVSENENGAEGDDDLGDYFATLPVDDGLRDYMEFSG